MDLKKLIKSIALPLIIGSIIGFIMMPFNDYQNLQQPPFSPPSIVFPIVWTILYILMGISAYLVGNQGESLTLYYFTLFFNYFWVIIFFIFKLRLIAFLWILVLIGLVFLMIIQFYKANKLAGVLQIPYLLWLLFACYLNIGVYLLN